ELSHLLASGDLDGALRIKTEQVEAQRGEVDKLARHSFELGAIQELRFDRPRALEAYREAWRLKELPEYGFKYAYLAQQQNHYDEAIRAYGAVLRLYGDVGRHNEAYRPYVAMTLNNLA